MELEARDIRFGMPDYKRLKRLYIRAFPKKERFPFWSLRLFTIRKIFKGRAFYDGGKLCGFAYTAEHENNVLILYLAINDELRGKGYGTAILKWLTNVYQNKTLFLDVERPDENAPNAAERMRRIEFYKRGGIYETNEFFSYDGVDYEILSTDVNFKDADYENFWRGLLKGKKKKPRAADTNEKKERE